MPNQMTIWDDSEEENEDDRGGGPSGFGGNSSDAHLDRGCSDLYEDDEDSETVPR